MPGQFRVKKFWLAKCTCLNPSAARIAELERYKFLTENHDELFYKAILTKIDSTATSNMQILGGTY
jgi:hypothetical protein